MIKRYCDLCEKEINSEVYYDMPIINKNGEFISTKVQLCENCCNKVVDLIKNLSISKAYKRLQNSISWSEEDDW